MKVYKLIGYWDFQFSRRALLLPRIKNLFKRPKCGYLRKRK